MTKKVVVNKSVAQWLREMGHDDYCDCYLHTDNDQEDDYEMWAHRQHCNSDLPDYAERIAAPYVSDALLWLMQKHGIGIHVMTIADRESETGYYYEVSLFVGKNWMARGFHNDYQYALYNALNELYHGRRRKD